MSQYSSPEAVLVPGPVTLVGPAEAAVDAFLAVVLFFAVSLWASTIVAARTIITSKNQVLSIYVLQFSGISTPTRSHQSRPMHLSAGAPLRRSIWPAERSRNISRTPRSSLQNRS